MSLARPGTYLRTIGKYGAGLVIPDSAAAWRACSRSCSSVSAELAGAGPMTRYLPGSRPAADKWKTPAAAFAAPAVAVAVVEDGMTGGLSSGPAAARPLPALVRRCILLR